MDPKPIVDATNEKKPDAAPAPTAPVAKTTSPAKPKVAPPSAPKLVTISNFEFSPSQLTINKGETVKWVNKDSAPHTVTSDAFKSNQLQQNNFYTETFTKPGTYPYHCTFHPSMVGSILVKQ
ncbi:cupredoxin domain-containing protein [Candidatus Peregrinibacteria bacterium]|nr:cupredoxin domain-containing protein [Candidatus Peregrinibacteria bacterium]